MKLFGLNPLQLVALKQQIGIEKARELSLPTLLYLDAAKLGRAPIAAENGLVMWVVTCQAIGSNANNRPFFDLACKAGAALFKAINRSSDQGKSVLDLTTGEYMTLRKLMGAYTAVLPFMQVGTYAACAQRAEATIEKMRNEP